MPGWDETTTEIMHRLIDPNQIQQGSFRRGKLPGTMPPVYAIYGKLHNGNGSMVMQALRFVKGDGWDLAKAKAWHAKNMAQRKWEMPDMEIRAFESKDLEVRAAAEGHPAKVCGYAARYNVLSHLISDQHGKYVERIRPGAFTRSLADPALDVVAQKNHDKNFVLGRTKNGTLTLRETPEGLYFEATPPDTQWARDHLAEIRGGYINEGSFGYYPQDEAWLYGENGQVIRELRDVNIADVSTVTMPAYPHTSVIVRMLESAPDQRGAGGDAAAQEGGGPAAPDQPQPEAQEGLDADVAAKLAATLMMPKGR